MKVYLLFLAGLLLALYALGHQLVQHYKPSVAVLERTTVVRGKVYFVGHHSGSSAEVSGVSFMCRMNFVTATESCTERVQGLREGTEVTVAVAYVPATVGTVKLAMSIGVKGEQVYATTPQQVIDEYAHSSRNGLLACAFFVLLVMFLMPLWYSVRFRESLAALFD